MHSLPSPRSRARLPVEHPAARAAAPDERIYGPFDARVRCRDGRGRRFDGRAALDDVSAEDFGLSLPVALAAGALVFAVAAVGRARVALRGVVTSADAPCGDLCRLRVRITRHRFVR